MPAETRVLTEPAEAAAVLRAGGLVAFPTETVYGLGAVAADALAVARLFVAKGRPTDNPLIVHLADAGRAGSVAHVTPLGVRLLATFAPGPLTVVLPARGTLPTAVTAGLPTVAVRVPAEPLGHALLAAVGVPVAAPSANRSGRPSPTTWAAVLDDLGGRIEAVLAGPPCAVGLESTVVDATGARAVVLRPGSVTLAQIRSVDAGAVEAAAGSDLAVRSPGTRHRHYAPRARVRVLAGPPEPDARAAFLGFDEPPEGYGLAVVRATPEGLAHVLFDTFRAADARGLVRIDVQPVEPVGIGRALMDRVRRAAAG